MQKTLRFLIATNDCVGTTIIRVVLGLVILAHGVQKLFGWFGGHGPDGTIEAFGTWFGLPAGVTVLVIAAETAGALALILGLVTRFAALSIGMVMAGAIHFVAGRWGFYMNWYSGQQGEGFEYHLLVLGMVAALMIQGGGRWSLDGRIAELADPGERRT